MLLINLGYFWSTPELDDLNVIIQAQGVNAFNSLNRDGRTDLPGSENRLFDPQLYLQGLDTNGCTNVISRLSTFPWLNPNAPEILQGEKQNTWEEKCFSSINGTWPFEYTFENIDDVNTAVESCINHQIAFGVNGLILPSPLTSDLESDYSIEMAWVDSGINVIPSDNELPVYATLAISDTILTHRDPNKIELLEIIVDQLTSRPELDGVYIVLEQTTPQSTYITGKRVAWGLLSLCHDLGIRGKLDVIVNFVNVFGFACVAAGAKSFGIGSSNKNKRLTFSDYLSRRGGPAFPKLYSHSLILDLFPKRDIEAKILKERLLRLVSRNRTDYSDSLFTALENGTDISLVPEWVESRNNTQYCKEHFFQRLKMAADEFNTEENKINYILTWLQDAERNSSYLAERFNSDPLSADIRHIKTWRAAFEEYINQYNL
ncbi:MAG: hypothetical protein JEZ06_00420 [Anaerolineaceae bacterium]|nr:hypothetical protein [Anaerolineaceae bacterium]